MNTSTTPHTHAFVEPYLFFGGRCEEALDYYKSRLGAQVKTLLRYSDSPEPMPPSMLPAGFENKVMHALFQIGDSALMGSDGNGVGAKYDGFRLSLAVKTEAEADRAFAALSDGGSVQMELAKTFWSPRFGMATDRFGIGWMVMVVPETQFQASKATS